MDISKLQVGQVYTYKQLCELTGVEYKAGTSRKCQLEGLGEVGFHRFFNFEKVNRGKYEILEIYDSPLNVEDKRILGNNSVYSVYIELLLMNHLSKQGVSHVETFMKKDLWRMLGMINEKYGEIPNESMRKINPAFTKFEVKEFYMRSNQKLEKILRSALNNLKNRLLIEWELLTIIHTENNGKEEWHVANDYEKKEILIAKREVLEKYGYHTIFQVFANDKRDEFFDDVNDILFERYNWDYFFNRYKIIFDAKNIREAIPETELTLQKILLNNEIVTYLNKEAENRYYKSMTEYNNRLKDAADYIEYIEAEGSWRLPYNYLVAQKLLVDELIKIDNSNNGKEIDFDQPIDFNNEYEDIEKLFMWDSSYDEEITI